MNVEQRQAAADPQIKPTDLSCESVCRLLLSTSTIVIYYYSVRKQYIVIVTMTFCQNVEKFTPTTRCIIIIQEVYFQVYVSCDTVV